MEAECPSEFQEGLLILGQRLRLVVKSSGLALLRSLDVVYPLRSD